MFVIVGLGNPGSKYELTRHNIGFLTIDRLAKREGVRVDKIKFKSLIGEMNINGEKIILVKPQTFMNLSGEAVREVMNFYKVDLENLLVVVDDIDITPFTIRLKKSGSAGSHNGMKSIIYNLNDDKFPRLKVGVGNNERKIDLANYVLSGFEKKDQEKLENIIDTSCDAILDFIKNGADYVMNNYNNKLSKWQLFCGDVWT